MSREHSDLVHKQIILDLTIRTLERDRKFLDSFKSHGAFNMWFENKIQEVKQEKLNVKRQLGALGIRIEKEVREDDFITVYEVLYRGATEYHRYFNVALRNWTNEEIKRLLNMEHKTVAEVNRKVYHK